MAADGYAVMPVCQIMIILTGTDKNLSLPKLLTQVLPT